jgi:hypothetical protein
MELEYRRGITLATSKTHSFKALNRHGFLLSSEGDCGTQASVGGTVSEAMTIRAEKVTLLGLRAHLFVGTVEVGQAEPLRSSLSMVKLERFEACGVTAPDTSAAVRIHKFTLSIATTLSK